MEGEELSWTLGKILLFASSQIEPKEGDTEAKQIGIYPSQISGHKFVPGGVLLSSDGDYSTDDEDDDLGGQFSHILYSLIFVLLLLFFCFILGNPISEDGQISLEDFKYRLKSKERLIQLGPKFLS